MCLSGTTHLCYVQRTHPVAGALSCVALIRVLEPGRCWLDFPIMLCAGWLPAVLCAGWLPTVLCSACVQEVKQELARRQGSSDMEPITQESAEFVYQQAQHAKQNTELQKAKEQGLPTPDFEACRAALPRVRLLPAGFDSSSSGSGSVEQRAARLLEAVLPRKPSDDHFAAVAAQKKAAPKQKQKAHSSKADKGAAAAAGSSAAATYKEAVEVAYEKAWGEQLAALEANLRLHEERGLGKVCTAVSTALYALVCVCVRVFLSTMVHTGPLRIQPQGNTPECTCSRRGLDHAQRHTARPYVSQRCLLNINTWMSPPCRCWRCVMCASATARCASNRAAAPSRPKAR